MLIWLRWRRERAERADAEAEVLIRELGVEAYAEARRREYESSDDAMAREWNRIALVVAGKIGKHIGLDTSSRMAMNAVFAPDRGVRPISGPGQVGEMERTLAANPQAFRVQFIGAGSDYGPAILREAEIQVADVSAAIIAVARIEWPLRTIAVRILDREGREVFSRQKADRR